MLSILGSVGVLVGKDDLRDHRGVDGRSLLPLIIWPASTHRSNWTTYPTPWWHNPSYTSHKLQPCDVGLFAPLKTAYLDEVERLYWEGLDTINKEHFISLYEPARERTITKRNIMTGCAATGLFLFDIVVVHVMAFWRSSHRCCLHFISTTHCTLLLTFKNT